MTPRDRDNAERQRQWRQRNATGNDHVTKRYAKVTPEAEAEAEAEAEGGSRARKARPAATAAPPPPIVVKETIPDRTPGGNGYHPPAEPLEPPQPPKREPSPEVAAVGEMANAIIDVTGISAWLNWPEVSALAADLVALGYTPDQLQRHYGKVAAPGEWNWYQDDWRGQTSEKRKGSPPRLKELRETIAGATQAATPVKSAPRPNVVLGEP